MRGKVTALLIFHKTKPYNDLQAAREKLAVRTGRAEALSEACLVLSRVNLPQLVFSESDLPDANWADVVSLSARASSPASVIVMGQEYENSRELHIGGHQKNQPFAFNELPPKSANMA
jgi:hypothetical protein